MKIKAKRYGKPSKMAEIDYTNWVTTFGDGYVARRRVADKKKVMRMADLVFEINSLIEEINNE